MRDPPPPPTPNPPPTPDASSAPSFHSLLPPPSSLFLFLSSPLVVRCHPLPPRGPPPPSSLHLNTPSRRPFSRAASTHMSIWHCRDGGSAPLAVLGLMNVIFLRLACAALPLLPPTAPAPAPPRPPPCSSNAMLLSRSVNALESKSFQAGTAVEPMLRLQLLLPQLVLL